MANPIMNATWYARITGIALLTIALLGIVLSSIGENGEYGLFCDGGKMTCEGASAADSFLAFDWTHNIVHVLLAAAALYVGFAATANVATLYAKVFGVVYAALGVTGFFAADLAIMHLELGENLVHLLIGAWGIVAGFFGATTGNTASTTPGNPTTPRPAGPAGKK